MNNLALIYDEQLNYKKAQELVKKALEIRNKSLGEKHPDVATSINNLAGIYRNQRRYSEAEKLYWNVILIWEEVYGENHSQVAIAYENLAMVFGVQEHWEKAYKYFEIANQIYVKQAKLNGAISLTSQDKNLAQLNTFKFKILSKLGYRYAKSDIRLKKDLSHKLFQRTQWMSGAGASSALSQMSVRFQAKDTRLSKLIRERQDLRAQWKALDSVLIKVDYPKIYLQTILFKKI